jgi:starch synthase
MRQGGKTEENAERSTSNVQHRMKILMISAEGPPLQRAGALVDVMDALPSALRDRGDEVSVVLPFYREIKNNRVFKKKNTGITVDVRVGGKIHVARYLECRSASGVQLFLIRCDEFLRRARQGVRR